MKFISKGNMKIGKIGNGAQYRMDEQFQHLLIFGILIIFQIKNKIWIPKVSNLENTQNFWFWKLAVLQIAIINWFQKWSNIRNFSIWKINEFLKFNTLKNWKKQIKCYNLENLKIINFTIWKINILQVTKLLNCANNLWIIKK